MELYEEIRREYEFGVGTIRGIARKLRVHRRMVREAIVQAVPPLGNPRTPAVVSHHRPFGCLLAYDFFRFLW